MSDKSNVISGVIKCVVPWCKNDSSSTTAGLYYFPSDQTMRSKWIKAIDSTGCEIRNLGDNIECDRVCSDHFRAECFMQTGGRKLLKLRSVPSLFSHAAIENEKQKPMKIQNAPTQASPQTDKTLKLIEDVLNCTDGVKAPTMTKSNTMFRLNKFPHVCRLCLKAPKSKTQLMVPLNAKDYDLDGDSIEEFLYDIMPVTAELEKDKQHLLPNAVCMPCLELLRFFARYRSKITTVHLFMNSLVELKHFNSRPMKNLFSDNADHVRAVIKDLDLCRLTNYSVEDLLDEFPLYDLASFEGFVIKEETEDKDEVQEVQTSVKNEDLVIDLDSDHFYADECTAEELSELMVPELATTIKRKRNAATSPGQSRPRKKKIKYDIIETVEPMHCSKCSYSTNLVPNFEKHKNMHTRRESRSYPCKNASCTEVFKTYREYYQHRVVAHKSFICETCGLTASTKAALAVHMQRHQKKYEYACPYCERKRNTKHDLNYHIKMTHMNAMDLACKICGMTYRGKHALEEHERTHGDSFNYPCKQCDKQFKRREALNKHIRTVHKKIRVFCEHCDSSFVSTYNLNNHIESVHGIQTRFVCDVCVLSCSSQHKLDIHRALHDNPHELQCGTCLAVFTSKELSADHLCITYKDDYVCCGRDHRYHFMYNKHMHIKHGIKTNVRVKPVPGKMIGEMIARRKRIETCPKCEQIFATRTLKKQHMEMCTAVADAEHKVASDEIAALGGSSPEGFGQDV